MAFSIAMVCSVLLLVTPVLAIPPSLADRAAEFAGIKFAYHGNDYSYVASGSGRLIFACDQERDGNKVYAAFRVRNGAGSVFDQNGADQGCGSFFADRVITSHVTCEKNVGCGSRVYP
jgi:hypothetical protein